MNTKEGSTKTVKFMTLGVGVTVLGCGNISGMRNFFEFFYLTAEHRTD